MKIKQPVTSYEATGCRKSKPERLVHGLERRIVRVPFSTASVERLGDWRIQRGVAFKAFHEIRVRNKQLPPRDGVGVTAVERWLAVAGASSSSICSGSLPEREHVCVIV